MDHQAELTKLADPEWLALTLLIELVRADREKRVVQAAIARDAARVYAPQAEVRTGMPSPCATARST